MPRKPLLLLCLLILSVSAAAQTSDAGFNDAASPSMAAVVKTMHATIRRNLAEAAAEHASRGIHLQADAPGPDASRELIGHVVIGNFFFCSQTKGEKSPKTQNFETASPTRPRLSKALNDSLAYCDEVYNGDDRRQLQSAGHDPRPERTNQTSPRSVLVFNTTHNNEHYGNIVVYMRLKGRVPPSTARVQKEVEAQALACADSREASCAARTPFIVVTLLALTIAVAIHAQIANPIPAPVEKRGLRSRSGTSCACPIRAALRPPDQDVNPAGLGARQLRARPCRTAAASPTTRAASSTCSTATTSRRSTRTSRRSSRTRSTTGWRAGSSASTSIRSSRRTACSTPCTASARRAIPATPNFIPPGYTAKDVTLSQRHHRVASHQPGGQHVRGHAARAACAWPTS